MDIREIIKQEQIIMYYQPIISTYQDRVSGVEALVRGIDEDGGLISPLELFKAASEVDMVIELDRLCQRKAIEQFATHQQAQHELILFLNVDNSVIHLDSNTNAIYDYCCLAGVNPGNVVLEINELHTADINAVKRFVDKYRGFGFMISIDDIGTGYSNLDRVVLLKPDIIKIDRALISDVQNHYYKQQVVSMIIHLSEKTGALVVAEGVEALDEVMTVLQFGAQLLQGFYIARPMDMNKEIFKGLEGTIRDIAEAQKVYLSNHLTNKCTFNGQLRGKYEDFNQILKASSMDNVSETLSWVLKNFPEVECAYVIDNKGRQMTDTVFNGSLQNIHRKSLFSPYKQGDDATLKAYYYVLKTTNQPQYVSEEYLSLATGHRCITISGYSTVKGEQVILCLDMVIQA